MHAAFIMADALAAFYTGQRSAGPRYEDVVRFFRTLPLERKELNRAVRHLTDLLAMDHVAEDEGRRIAPSEGTQVLRHMTRFREWAATKLVREK